MKDNTPKKKEGSFRRIFWTAVTIVINLTIVGYIAFHEISGNAGNIRSIPPSEIQYGFIALGFLCFGLAVFAEYRKYLKMIVASEGRCDREGAINCVLIGKYYDNITPFGAGGQPFQIYYLRKRGMAPGTANTVPIVGFITQQFAFVILAGIVFVGNRNVLGEIALIRYAAYVGLLLYLALPVMILLFAFVPKPFKKFIKGVSVILTKLHIFKNADKASERICGALDEYTLSLKKMGERPFILVSLILFSALYQTAILSVPFFMIRAFGGTGSWWTIFSITVYIYSAITIVPTPGNSGAAEGSFYAVFSSLEGGFLFWAMVIWRIIVYFSWIITGIIAVTRSAVKKSVYRKKKVPASGPLRVALFIDIYYPNIDGVIKTVDSYAREINKSGSYACVFCPKSPRKHTDDLPYDVVRLPAIRLKKLNLSIGLPFTGRKFKNAFAKKNFDVIHVHSPFGSGRIGMKLGKKFDIPVVSTFHSKYYDDAMNLTHSKSLAKITANIVSDFFSTVDHAWACSNSTAKTLRSYGYKGNIRVVENGVDPFPECDPREKAAEAAEKFGIPGDKKILLFVGQQIWQKNLKTVLDSTKLAAETDPDIFTVIVGGGYNGAQIRKYAESIGVSDRVIFTGKISDRALLFGVYKLASLFFFPSLYDNAPIVLREAALAGVPALLTAGSSSAEIVTDGVNGYTEENDPGLMSKKILSILSSGELSRVAENARATIPVFWSEIVKTVTEKYREM
ncbi:MAG: flippase-like domain-containing protein [Clostridia bacterium]|nr:flippase-like domain-containing protein [Clostridia bacterium]